MALREVNIPQHISILYVQQEVVGDDTPAIDSVLQADVHRTRLMAEEAELNALLQSMEEADAKAEKDGVKVEEDETKEKKRNRKADDATARLGEVQKLLVEIDADSGPSRAAELMAGLGFSASDQVSGSRFRGGNIKAHSRLFYSSCLPRPSLEDGGCVSPSLVVSVGSGSPASSFRR